MPLIEWKNEYSVSVYEIDVQHKNLFDIINKLNIAMQQDRGNLVLGQIITELVLYAQLHFWTEEKYFDIFHYKETIKHKVEHQKFVTEIKAFKVDFDNGNVDLPERVLHFLKEWLKSHVLGEDMKYVGCFKQNGLS